MRTLEGGGAGVSKQRRGRSDRLPKEEHVNGIGRAALAAIALALSGPLSACTSAEAQGQSEREFTLEEHDKIVAEAPGCSAECRIVGPNVRRCVLKDYGCAASCMTLPECRPDGLKPMKVCAVVKTRP